MVFLLVFDGLLAGQELLHLVQVRLARGAETGNLI